MQTTTTQTDAEPKSMADRGLDCCPVCNYLLTGLPLEHRCPACGFQYDEHTQVWRNPPLRWDFGRVLAVAVVALIMLGETVSLLSGVKQTGTVFSFVKITTCIAAGIFLGRRYSRGRGSCLVAIAPTGAVLRLRGKEVLVVPWSEVDEVKVLFGVPRRTVLLATTAETCHRLGQIIFTKLQALDFGRVVAEGKVRYRSRAAAASLESDK